MSDSVASKSILLLAANPKGTVSLRLQEEEREIKERLRLAGYGKVPINSTGATRTRDIQQAMLDFKPQIVHFTGHGTGKDGLAFEDVTGEIKLVESDALANLFQLFSSHVECVILNACYSKFQAEAIAQHIDYVVGMEQAIGDHAAIEFAVGFYTALGAGESIEFAYRLGCNAIQLAGIPEHLTPIIFAENNAHENSENRNPEKSISSTDQGIKSFPSNTRLLSAEEFCKKTREKYEAEDYQGAITAYTKAISLQPNNPDLYINRGKARDQLKDCRDFRGALLDFTEAIRLQPNNHYIYACRGEVKHDLRDYQGAVEDFTEVIRLQPNNAYAHCHRGLAKERIRDEKGAISDFNEAIRLDSTYVYAYFRRGMVKFQHEPQGSLADFTEVMHLKPNFAPAYEFRGMLKSSGFTEAPDKQGAIADYREAVSLYKQERDIEKVFSILERIEKLEKENENKGFWRWLLS